ACRNLLSPNFEASFRLCVTGYTEEIEGLYVGVGQSNDLLSHVFCLRLRQGRRVSSDIVRGTHLSQHAAPLLSVLNGDALLGYRKFISGVFLDFVSGRMGHANRSLRDSPG